MSFVDWANSRMFNLVHRNNLVYNTCWEDPRLDRVALDLGPDDNVLVITSAGCNALDYALTEPNHVFAVDMNPRQNALLELKIAGIRSLDFETFFELFGRGRMQGVRDVYESKMRRQLTPFARRYWDRKIKFFNEKGRPFYYRGTSGSFAKAVNFYVDRVIHVREHLDALLDADDVGAQREIYDSHLRDRFWSKPMRFAMSRDYTLSLVGVPRAQRQQVERDYSGGIVKFVMDCVEAVLANLPLQDNYFWRVYMTGEYTPDCCPEYLKRDNFEKLRDGLVDKVSTHTNSVQGFLDQSNEPISKFVLLDHMDWLSHRFFHLLEDEWQSILNRATPDARFIWRSGGLRTDFVDRVRVTHRGTQCEVGELLEYNRELASQLHVKDRVHTYGSFYIANLAA